MPEPTPERAYRPIDAGSGGAPPVMLRALVPIVLVCALVVVVAPAVLRQVLPGWPGGGSAESVARLTALALLGAVLAASGVSEMRRRRTRQREVWGRFAAEVGGTLTEEPVRVRAGRGWEGGLGVTYTLDNRPVSLSCHRPRSSGRYTRLAATIPLRRDIQLQVLANTTANRVLMSAAIWSPLLRMAAQEAGTGPEQAERARALERMRFLAAEPTATGDPTFDRAFLLKASDGEVARDAVADPGVRAALDRLLRRDRYFRLSLVGMAAPGPAQLEVELADRPADLDRLRCMHDVLQAVMARLDRSGLLEAAARRAS
jgi:hypothetical protein